MLADNVLANMQISRTARVFPSVRLDGVCYRPDGWIAATNMPQASEHQIPTLLDVTTPDGMEGQVTLSDGTTQGLADLQHIVGKPIQGSMLRVLMSAQEGRKVKAEREKQERTDDTAEIELPSTPPTHTIYKQDTPRSTPTDGSWSEERAAQGRPRSFPDMQLSLIHI